MKFEIWGEGDRSVGIQGMGARVEIDGLEDWDDEEAIKATVENLRMAFETIFDDTRVYVVEATKTGVIDHD